ncbi:uncharacterized protein LOC125662565 [Ostrea edulis]|uniref:uncharacterized protein LOC125662565 n=1 Tax=Ostrea edulis TaxID=37623 RepID=UPI0024AF58F0|nr:uncharacterized protein LOC125662565 [Ostrea edulis]
MLTRTYFFCLMIFSIVFQRTIQNGVYLDYAVRTHSLPTTTCLRVNDVKSTWRCFSTCLKKMNYFYMFSHNNPDQSCACCTDQTGSALTGTKWKTYIPPACPDGYTTYQYKYFKICLKYVAMDTKYPDAVNFCNADGGDLIRIDSQQKYDLFRAHLAPYAAINVVQVWIQGVEHGTEWKFHDGTSFPNLCSISQSNNVNEIHLRYKTPNDACIDAPPSDRYHYMCEVYRRFSYRN